MKNIMITGAASRIGEATSILVAKELKPETMFLTDKPGSNLNKVATEILETGGCSHVENLYVDLAEEDAKKRWQELPEISGLVLCAAAGLGPGMTIEQIQSINYWSQITLAEIVFREHADPSGCHCVFINSLWGHNLTRKFPHDAYQPIAMHKNQTEIFLRSCLAASRPRALPHTINIVVSSMVARTFASILVKRTLSKEYPEDQADKPEEERESVYERLIRSLPEEHEVTIEEAAQGILTALTLEKTGQTVWVPPSAREWASEEMLALSSNT